MKIIYVGIDGSKESFDSYRCASGLFPGVKVDLTAVFVRDERKTQIPYIYSGAAYDIGYERLYIPVDPQLIKTYEKLNEDNKIFAEKCIKICESIELNPKIKKSGLILEGDPSEQLMEISKKSNLLVLGQRGENASYKHELIGSTSEDLIRKSEVPVLICPGDKINLNRALLVYEGNVSSENAIDYFIRELSDNSTVLQIIVKNGMKNFSKECLEKIDILKQKKITVNIESCSYSLAQKSLEMMESGLVDVFILGSHGKHKLTEHLLGSNTVHIIRKSSIPVFIIH